MAERYNTWTVHFLIILLFIISITLSLYGFKWFINSLDLNQCFVIIYHISKKKCVFFLIKRSSYVNDLWGHTSFYAKYAKLAFLKIFIKSGSKTSVLKSRSHRGTEFFVRYRRSYVLKNIWTINHYYYRTTGKVEIVWRIISVIYKNPFHENN